MKVEVIEDLHPNYGYVGEIWANAETGDWIFYRRPNEGNITEELIRDLESAQNLEEAKAAFRAWLQG